MSTASAVHHQACVNPQSTHHGNHTANRFGPHRVTCSVHRSWQRCALYCLTSNVRDDDTGLCTNGQQRVHKHLDQCRWHHPDRTPKCDSAAYPYEGLAQSPWHGHCHHVIHNLTHCLTNSQTSTCWHCQACRHTAHGTDCRLHGTIIDFKRNHMPNLRNNCHGDCDSSICHNRRDYLSLNCYASCLSNSSYDTGACLEHRLD